MRFRDDREDFAKRAFGSHKLVGLITAWDKAQAVFAGELVALIAEEQATRLSGDRHLVTGLLYVIDQRGYTEHPKVARECAALIGLYGDQGPPTIADGPARQRPIDRGEAELESQVQESLSKWRKYPTE